MITKFDTYNESLKNKLKGKSEEDVEKLLYPIINTIYKKYSGDDQTTPNFAYQLRYYLVSNNINRGFIDFHDNINDYFQSIVNKFLISKNFNKRRIKNFWENYLWRDRQWME